MKPFDEQLVSGSVFRSVYKLAWPAVMLNLINGMHGFVDNVLVAHVVGKEGNAGVGLAWQLFLVMVVFIASLCHGMSVLVARYAGKQDREALGRIVYHTFLSSAVLLIGVAAPVGYLLSPFLLSFFTSDPGVLANALPYIRILFTCSAPLFTMFLLTYAFNASGDPKTPLFLGVLTTVLNVVMSAVLIAGLGPFPRMGSAGAALATCLAPVPSVAIAIGLILTHRAIIPPPPRFTLRPDFSVLRVAGRIGVPAGLQGVLLNLAGLMLFAFMRSLEHSAAAQAAYTICYSQLFSLVTFASMGLRSAAATIVGQNLGAEKPRRARRGVYVAAAMGAAWAGLLGIIYWTAAPELLALFDVTDPNQFAFAQNLLRYLAVSGLAISMALAFTGGLQGSGDTLRPLIITFFSQIGVLLGVCTVFLALGTLTASHIWAAILASHTVRLLLTALVFYQGKWVHTKVHVGE